MYNVGCLIGCLSAAILGYKLGRRRAIFIGCSIMLVGAIIQASIHGTAQLIVGRIISGVGNGAWLPYFARCIDF
jgi:MFS family permease